MPFPLPAAKGFDCLKIAMSFYLVVAKTNSRHLFDAGKRVPFPLVACCGQRQLPLVAAGDGNWPAHHRRKPLPLHLQRTTCFVVDCRRGWQLQRNESHLSEIALKREGGVEWKTSRGASAQKVSVGNISR